MCIDCQWFSSKMVDEMKPKKVAVIGAGASGLTAIKCSLDEGLEPVCLERTSNIGGLWRYTENVQDGQGSVMKSTVINTSKEMMSWSDFPVPAEYANFMHHTQVLKYFKMYSEQFGLEKHIRFNTEVLKVRQTEKFATTGQWEIEIKDKSEGEVTSEVFDGVLVCTGHHAEKKMPKLPGQDLFKGEILHSQDLRNNLRYKDKRVVVLGIGNSGVDAAVDLSKACSQVCKPIFYYIYLHIQVHCNTVYQMQI